MRRAGVALLAIAMALGATGSVSAAPARRGCCRLAAGTMVKVELVDQVSSASRKPGDTFALRLAAPVVVDGMVVLRKGAPGVGEVIDASRPGIGGKPGKMVLAARYVRTGRTRVPLNALKLARPGRNNSRASQVLGLGGMAFAPLGIMGIVVPGGDATFPPGTGATAKVARAVTLPPLGRASSREIAEATSGVETAPADEGPIAIPPPAKGQGQVVFFRAKSLLGLGQWFNVREDGKALGKLTNGAYFVQAASPGVHTYTAKLEPELNDRLRIKVDPGETYFVEGALTGGLVLGAANLAPSTRERFDKAAKDLKPAGAPGSDKEEKESAERAAADTRTTGNSAQPQPQPH